MKYKQDGRRYVIALSRGERVLSALTNFCEERNIVAGVFQAIGAVEKPEIGYYDVHKKEYFFTQADGEFEVASMNGNIALVDGKPFVHAHAVLTACDTSGKVLGAHLKEAYVAVTLEVFFIALDAELVRALDADIGLKLLDL